MTLNVNISDPKSKIQAEVVDGIERTALVVATRPLKEFDSDIKVFLNSDYGIDMNLDASAGGTPLPVHNGIDDVLWTGTNIVDIVDFNDTARYNSGAASIGFDGWSSTGDLCQIAKGSTQDLSAYVSLSMYVNVDSRWTSLDSVSIYGWNTSTGLMIGSKALLENYANLQEYDVWHKITIPLSDMALTGQTIDAIRFQYENRDGVAVNFYVDDIQFEETGTTVTFEVVPDKKTWCHVDTLMFSLVDALDTTLLNSNMFNLSYDKLLGVSALPIGVIWRRLRNGSIKSSFTIKQLGDVLELSLTKIKSIGCDGTNTFLNIEITLTEQIILKEEEADRLTISISDDLSGLLRFRAYAGCKIEYR